MKEQLLGKIRTIADSEKFKMDAFFLCGAKTGTPNKTLLDACEKYIKAAESDNMTDDIAEALIAELENAASAEKETLGVNTANNNADFIRELLNNKDALFYK